MTATFHDSLLGKPSHEALIKHQEYEIKLLEVIRKTVSARIKCDKDYAQSLQQLLQIISKVDAPCYNSSVYEAWKAIANDISQAIQSRKRNAESLQTSTYDKLVNLIKDKTAIKKTYADNRERIDSQLLKVMHTDLEKKRSLYMKTESETAKYHQAYDQSINKKNANVNAQEKFRKSTMKLHNYHNDYVLQVEEAKMHQKHYRTSVLPQLLNGLQYMEMQYVDTIKEILEEYLCITCPSREEFVSSHKHAEDKVALINSANEYDLFIELRKSALEVEANIKFEPLVGEGAALPHGQIFLNSLSLQGIEHLVNRYQDDLDVIRSQIDNHNQHLNDLDEEIRQFSQNKDSLTLLMKQQDFMNTKLELIEKENLHLREQQLYHLLSQSMQELGDQDPPPGIVLADLPQPEPVSNNDKGQGKSLLRMIGVMVKPPSSSEKVHSVFDPTKALRDQAWFHGTIPRDESVRLLDGEGSFLLRESTKTAGEMVLSAISDGQPRHFLLKPNETVREILHLKYEKQYLLSLVFRVSK